MLIVTFSFSEFPVLVSLGDVFTGLRNNMTWAPILSIEDWIEGGYHTNCEAIVEGLDKSDYDKKTPRGHQNSILPDLLSPSGNIGLTWDQTNNYILLAGEHSSTVVVIEI